MGGDEEGAHQNSRGKMSEQERRLRGKGGNKRGKQSCSAVARTPTRVGASEKTRPSTSENYIVKFIYKTVRKRYQSCIGKCMYRVHYIQHACKCR